jgi:uncharacterized protein (TIGR03086 family)
MSVGTTTALTGAVALLERALGFTLGSLTLVTADAMQNPTPCPDWDLRALLSHVDDSLLALHEAAAVGRVGLRPAEAPVGPVAAEPVPEDPVAALREHASRTIGAWVNVAGPGEVSIGDRALSSSIIVATGAVDIAVHGWDVARACRQHRPVPPTLAEDLLDLCLLIVRDTDRPARFAAAMPVSPAANPSDRLVAFLGRCP